MHQALEMRKKLSQPHATPAEPWGRLPTSSPTHPHPLLNHLRRLICLLTEQQH